MSASGQGTTLLSFLQSELLILANEARRKHTDIKDVIRILYVLVFNLSRL